MTNAEVNYVFNGDMYDPSGEQAYEAEDEARRFVGRIRNYYMN
mgnify:CR=1 FL=1